MCDPISATVVLLAGTAYQMNQAHEAQNTAERHAKAEADRLQGIQNDRNANIAKVDAAYGVGTSPEAQKNASTLADSINNYYNDYLSNSLKSVDNQYAGVSRTSRQNLARTGQLGSSLDTGAQSSNLADFLRGRQQAVASAASAKSNLASQLSQQRINLDNQISGGTVANPDVASLAGQQQSVIRSAQSQIAPNAIGSLFNTAGSTYFNGQTQSAQGNQGLQAFGFGTSNNRGKITS
jgi:hypothetical protein